MKEKQRGENLWIHTKVSHELVNFAFKRGQSKQTESK